jgi:HSP20 family molecular chaperone IbpA
VKVVVKDGCVRIHAKHVSGDEFSRDIRESDRTVRIPEGVDQTKIHCYMSSENQYTVEGPVLQSEKENAIEIQLEAVPAIPYSAGIDDVDMQVAEQRPFQENLDLSVFDPDHINITRQKNIVSVFANHSCEEDGVQVQRSFRKEFTLPEDVDCKQVKAVRGADGKISIMAPKIES